MSGAVEYLFCGSLWGVMAIAFHAQLYPKKVEWWRLIAVFVVNSVLWPICIGLAIVNAE